MLQMAKHEMEKEEEERSREKERYISEHCSPVALVGLGLTELQVTTGERDGNIVLGRGEPFGRTFTQLDADSGCSSQTVNCPLLGALSHWAVSHPTASGNCSHHGN